MSKQGELRRPEENKRKKEMQRQPEVVNVVTKAQGMRGSLRLSKAHISHPHTLFQGNYLT